MKRFKLLLVSLVLLLVVSSCNDDIKEVVKPEEITTIELQKMPKDTVLLVINDNKAYLFDKESLLVKYELEGKTDVGDFMFLILIVFILGIFFGILLTSR